MSASPNLRPREHGAYAMLAFPILSGLLVGGPSLSGVAFAVLAVTGFLAHESVLVVLGGRGERLRSAHETAARRRLARLGATGLALGSAFVLWAPDAAWPPVLLTAVLGVLVAGLLAAGRTRTLGGELLVAATFASVHGPVAAAGGASTSEVYLPAAAWTASFVLATLAVHSLKFRFKRRGPGAWTVATTPLVAAVAIGVAILAVGTGHSWWGGAAAVLPKAAVVLGLAYLAIHPRHMKRVGWTLVVTDTVTLLLLAVLVR